MRRFALAVLGASGCIISAPDGAPQSWPPPLGVDVQAVTAGDLDGNGSTDIVVYSAGTSSQAGMYLLTNGKDLGATAASVKSFSTFVSTELQTPTAALLLPGAAPSVYVATGSGSTVELTQYSNILTEKAHVATTVPIGTGPLWVHPVAFPGNMLHMAVSNGSALEHVAPDFADDKPIPPMGTPTWDGAQVATSYTSGMDAIAVVAAAQTIQRATLPTAMTGGMFMWSTVRTGAPWAGQTTFDLNGDGREEVIGLDITGKQLCVVDPGAATIPVTPACLALPMLPGGSEVTLLVGTNITMAGSPPDILIVQASATATAFTLVEDYAYTAGVLTASMIHDIPVTGPAHGHAVIVNAGPGTPNVVLVFGNNGAVSCVLGPC